MKILTPDIVPTLANILPESRVYLVYKSDDARIKACEILDNLGYTWASGHRPTDYVPRPEYDAICLNRGKKLGCSQTEYIKTTPLDEIYRVVL
jgi:hypothetical protein